MSTPTQMKRLWNRNRNFDTPPTEPRPWPAFRACIHRYTVEGYALYFAGQSRVSLFPYVALSLGLGTSPGRSANLDYAKLLLLATSFGLSLSSLRSSRLAVLSPFVLPASAAIMYLCPTDWFVAVTPRVYQPFSTYYPFDTCDSFCVIYRPCHVRTTSLLRKCVTLFSCGVFNVQIIMFVFESVDGNELLDLQ